MQNPDKHPGVVIVLKSREQGTGKSTLGVVMLKIFGQHGALIDDSDRLLGRFNDWIEPVCFILAEEILWAGDHKTADKLKSRVTANTFQIEHKGGAVRQIPNRLHLMMTTNHDHAVGLGVGDRRFVVYDVSDEHACDKTWFEPLYRDLEDGGYGEFLYLLQNIQLSDWHPREILKTAETTEQQRMSGDSVSQWSRACIDADALIHNSYGGSTDLGQRIASDGLRESYSGYCKQHGLRPVSMEAFGKACTEMFGPRVRLGSEQAFGSVETWRGQLQGSKRRPWGYDVPDGDTWQEKIDARLGIQHSALAGSTTTTPPATAVKIAPLAAVANTAPRSPRSPSHRGVSRALRRGFRSIWEINYAPLDLEPVVWNRHTQPAPVSARRACPTLSHVPAASETAKNARRWGTCLTCLTCLTYFEINRQNKERKVGKACRERKLAKAPCAETSETCAVAADVCGETPGLRHR